MARLSTAQQADLTDLESIILNDDDFAELLKDEKQVEDILERSYLVETMESAILAHDRRQAETEVEPSPTGLLTAFRNSRRKIGSKKKPAVKENFGQRMAAIRKAKPAKRKAKTVYTSGYVVNPDKTLGAIRNVRGQLVEGRASEQPFGIETYKAIDGGTPELIGRKMYSKNMLKAILDLPSEDYRRLHDLVSIM